MSVAQEEATCLRKLNGIGGLGDAGAQEEEHSGRDGKIWTHGKLLSSTSPNVQHLRGQFVPATVRRQPQFYRSSSVSFFGHSSWRIPEALCMSLTHNEMRLRALAPRRNQIDAAAFVAG